ncbi:MAG: Methicillin resistance protein [Gemmataceae bacterium]|nr:Methicillin resistance protein [Gemmataceae bacterium]
MRSATAPALLRHGDLRVEVVRHASPEREGCERELLASGLPLPFPHRCAWAEVRRGAESWFLALRDETNRCRGGFAVEINRSRALPWHRILRVERFGHGLPPDLLPVAVLGLRDLARRTPRVLRAHVEVFSPVAETRQAAEAALRIGGFGPTDDRRRYANTIAIDLRPDESAVLAAFHRSARKKIRAASKRPVAVRPIEDKSLVPRILELDRETRDRTGGKPRPWDWTVSIGLSKQHPTLSRLIGLFRTDRTGPESLLAFAWGCGHGDYGQCEAAGSTRNSDLRVPLAYPLIWDLVCWAKRNGATWFDLGGITQGHFGSDDPLGGISDFKRYFSKNVVPVGGEWILEPRWLRSRAARAISAGAAWLSGLRPARKPAPVPIPEPEPPA